MKRKALSPLLISFTLPLVLSLEWMAYFALVPPESFLFLKAFLVLFFSIISVRYWKLLSCFEFRNALIYFGVLHLIHVFFSSNLWDSFFYTIRILYWIGGTFSIYVLLRSKHLTLDTFRKLMQSIVLVALITTLAVLFNLNSDEYSNGNAYLLLWCLPVMNSLRTSRLDGLLLILILAGIIGSIKRGAIIASLTGILSYVSLSLYYADNLRRRLRSIQVLLLVLFVGAVILSFKSGLVLDRFSDSTGSGRVFLYTSLLFHYATGDVLELLFGYGLKSVQLFTAELYHSTSGKAAHSDILQFLHDFGLLGVFFTIWFNLKFLRLIREYKNSILFRKDYVLLASAYPSFVLVSIYSITLSSPVALYLGMMLAFFSAQRLR